ncbi:MAG TPA: hypothetical protein VK956_03895 [Verrucomicrobium sp.]|nr:hypothetical protein [Verrucomicrobium sp.]
MSPNIAPELLKACPASYNVVKRLPLPDLMIWETSLQITVLTFKQLQQPVSRVRLPGVQYSCQTVIFTRSDKGMNMVRGHDMFIELVSISVKMT